MDELARTGLLSGWTSWVSYGLAAINLAFVPSMFFGNTPEDFYAANGWGTTALTGALLGCWVLALGVSLLRPTVRWRGRA